MARKTESLIAAANTPVWRRADNARRVVASILTAGLLAGIVDIALFPTAAIADDAPVWTSELPGEIGSPMLAQQAEDVVLVTGQTGMTALERDSGEIAWHQELDDGALALGDGEVLPDAASAVTMIVGDTVVVTERDSDDFIKHPTQLRILDLATGRERFTVEAEPEVEMDGAATARTLAVQQCPEDREAVCTLTGYNLADGAVAWRLDEEYGRGEMELPKPPHSTILSGRTRPADIVPEHSFAVLSSSDGAGDTTVTSVNLLSGETGQWTDDWQATLEYQPYGEWLMVYEDESKLSVVDPGNGERQQEVPLPAADIDAANNFYAHAMLLDDGSLLAQRLEMEDRTAYTRIDTTTWEVLAGAESDAPLVTADTGTVVSMSGAQRNPVLHGLDLASGEESWRLRVPELSDPGYQSWYSDAGWLVASDGILGLSAVDTRVVKLSNGDSTRIRNVTALGVFGDRLYASSSSDGTERLEYYDLNAL